MRSITLRSKILRGVLVVALLALGVFGVRTAGPGSLPTAATFSSGWTLKVEFANALNLPDRARVLLNGREVGNMESLRLVGDRALATLTMSEQAVVPADATAELRQDTLLGDMYILILSSPTSTANPLRSGGVIPLKQSKPADQIEDLMVSASGFLGSGGVAQLGNTVQRLDGAFPDDPARTRKIIANVAATLKALAHDDESLDLALRSFVGLTDKLAAERGHLDAYLTPAGMERWGTIAETARVASVYSGLAPLMKNLSPLTPGVTDLANLMTQVVSPLLLFNRPVGATRPDNLINLRNLFRDTIVPWVVNGPKINVVKVSDGQQVPTAERAEQAVRTMRMIGAVR